MLQLQVSPGVAELLRSVSKLLLQEQKALELRNKVAAKPKASDLIQVPFRTEGLVVSSYFTKLLLGIAKDLAGFTDVFQIKG